MLWMFANFLSLLFALVFIFKCPNILTLIRWITNSPFSGIRSWFIWSSLQHNEPVVILWCFWWAAVTQCWKSSLVVKHQLRHLFQHQMRWRKKMSHLMSKKCTHTQHRHCFNHHFLNFIQLYLFYSVSTYSWSVYLVRLTITFVSYSPFILGKCPDFPLLPQNFCPLSIIHTFHTFTLFQCTLSFLFPKFSLLFYLIAICLYSVHHFTCMPPV